MLRIALALVVFSIAACKSPAPKGAALSESTESEDEDGPNAQLLRFEPWLATLEAALESEADDITLDSVADELVNGPCRIAAYNLQALSRIYEPDDELFGKLRADFKDLEDVIGAYDKWHNLAKKAKADGASAAKINSLQAREAKALADLKDLLVKRDWFKPGNEKSRLAKMRKKLAMIDWRKYKKDRKVVLQRLAEEIKSVRKTDYQFKHLEEGNGLHELRRNLKWIVIEMRVLNGLVTFDGEMSPACPLMPYQLLLDKPIATSKYSQLPLAESEKKPCYISQCLFLGLVQAVEDFGALKDQIEAELNIKSVTEEDDKVPSAFRPKAERLYADMKNNELFKIVEAQIESCQAD